MEYSDISTYLHVIQHKLQTYQPYWHSLNWYVHNIVLANTIPYYMHLCTFITTIIWSILLLKRKKKKGKVKNAISIAAGFLQVSRCVLLSSTFRCYMYHFWWSIHINDNHILYNYMDAFRSNLLWHSYFMSPNYLVVQVLPCSCIYYCNYMHILLCSCI